MFKWSQGGEDDVLKRASEEIALRGHQLIKAQHGFKQLSLTLIWLVNAKEEEASTDKQHNREKTAI